jgi:hypothetical protein
VRRACSGIANARADRTSTEALCGPHATTAVAVAYKHVAAANYTYLTVGHTNPGGYTPVTANADSLTCPRGPGSADV